MLRVTLCQMVVGRDKVKNIEKALDMIASAADRGSELAVLPECFNCPYGTKYFGEYAEALVPGYPTFDAISKCAETKNIWVIAGSIPERSPDGKLYNSSMVFGPDGCLKHVHRKVHLFRLNTQAVKFDESEVLTAGDDVKAIEMSKNVKFGVAICFDIRYPLLALKYTMQGTSFLIYPGAFNMVTGPAHWELSAKARAVDNQQFVLMCSPARDSSAEYVAWGHSMIVDPMGRVIAQADENEGFVDCNIDLSLVEKTRDQIPILKGIRNDLYNVVWKE